MRVRIKIKMVKALSSEAYEAVKKGAAKAKLKNKLGNICVFCGCTNKLMLTIDHIQPLIRGGRDEDYNKQVVCYFDNQIKGALNNTEYRKYLKSLCVLKELCKLKVKFEEPKLEFKSWHYPILVIKKEVKIDEEKK